MPKSTQVLNPPKVLFEVSSAEFSGETFSEEDDPLLVALRNQQKRDTEERVEQGSQRRGWRQAIQSR